MRRAIQAGAPDSEATAWSEVHLGHLLFTIGDLDGAARAYQNATTRVERYVYGVAGLARVRAARGDLAGAASLYQQAAERMPLPEFVVALGDTYARLGDEGRAQQQYELVGAIQRLLAANGVRTDVDIALFDADHDVNLESALEMARLEYKARQSVQVADTLAWAEYKLGDLDSALGHSREALRLGTRDPLMLYRAGVIAQVSGDPQGAYALLSSVNPSFSIRWADDLASRLSELSKMGAQP
jgi:tetratricopeptide (TPR) repeat protein